MTQRELELAKSNLTEIYEKQIRFLKEQKEDLEFKVETLGAHLREKQVSSTLTRPSTKTFSGKAKTSATGTTTSSRS